MDKVLIETSNGNINIYMFNNRLYFEGDNSIIKISSNEDIYSLLDELFNNIINNEFLCDKPFVKDKVVYYSDEVNYIDDDYASSMIISKDEDNYIISFKEGFDTIGNKTSRVMINNKKSKYGEYTEYFTDFYNKLNNNKKSL